MTGQTSALHNALAEPAAQARARFAGARNGYLDGSDVVHAVALLGWLGLQVPGPACHVGTGTWDFTRFRSTSSPVTCGRCHAAGCSSVAVDDQDVLDLGL